jgi:radical SAM superfamily enzyme YgiQ (UPF0313 family)
MDKLDALLINPISAKTIPAFIPHGLLYIAAYVIQNGYNIDIYDRNVEEKDVLDILQLTRPKVVGLGCLTGSPIDDSIYISKKIREFDCTIKIVWGGVHTSLYPDSVIKQDFVDYVVTGDGEKGFTGILDMVIKNKIDINSIDNLVYELNGKIKRNQITYTDLNEIPLPAWHLIKVENYIRKKFYANRVLTINTSRGCPYKCKFCSVPAVHQRRWRAVKPEIIIDNLKYLKENYNIDGFQVDDDEFDINKKRVLELCELMKSNNINLKWSHFSRVNIVKEDLLKKEIDSGLRLIEFGVESGSARMLKFLGKDQTIEQIRNAFNICGRLKIKTSALFMIGLPSEEEKEVTETVNLVKRLGPHQTICTIYKPYPGTELFDYCVAKKLIKCQDNLSLLGEYYEKTINTSSIDTDNLLKVKNYFDRRNIFQELKSIFIHFRFKLLSYYISNYIFKSKSKDLKW